MFVLVTVCVCMGGGGVIVCVWGEEGGVIVCVCGWVIVYVTVCVSVFVAGSFLLPVSYMAGRWQEVQIGVVICIKEIYRF